MRLRYPIILGVLAVVLAAGAFLAAHGAIAAMSFLQGPFLGDGFDPRDVARAQAAMTTLVDLVPFAALAAAIPAIGALMLLVLRSRESARLRSPEPAR